MSVTIADCDPAVLGCIESCTRLLQVLESVTPAQFRARWKGHNGIGPHTRHCIEHLASLQGGFEHGVIDYDARARDRALEEDPVASAAIVRNLTQWLRELPAHLLDTPLIVVQIPQVDMPATRAASSLRRELLFINSHTIHHLALVTMLAEVHEIPVPGRLGLAYSTQAYERAQAAQPRGASGVTS